MELINFIDGTNSLVIEASIKLAVSEAPAMIGTVIGADSPLLPLAEAEVEALLRDSLEMVGAYTPQVIEGVMCELNAGVIAAIDTSTDEPELVGFIQYKPRALTNGVATIGYAAVSSVHRGKGIFKQMLDLLKTDYPVLGLDCPLELVPMYESLGFKVDNAQGAHVGMSNGSLTGKNWMRGQDFLDAHPAYLRAKEAIRTALGKNTKAAYAKRDYDTQARIAEINALLAAQ